MQRLCWLALATLALAVAPVAAEPTQVGGWFGPRIFSSRSQLGYLDDAPAHPELKSAIELGARVGQPFLPWMIPELELAFAPTSTTAVGGAKAASVFWLEPRLQLRFERSPERRIQPFAIIGGGTPISLSSAKKTFGTSIVGEGYIGGGVKLDTTKGFLLRVDARVAILPANADASFGATAELEVGFGVEVRIGGPRRAKPDERLAAASGPDRDGDGVPDAADACPDRAEDIDGFEDADGCPDIDNDLDRVLDIADKCPNVAETYNGFEDDDGCPDALPADVDALRGTVEGLLYAEGETLVRPTAQPAIRRIAKTLAAHPSIRVVLIGHTDDREAKQLADASQELDAVSMDLAKARAEAVKNALLAAGAGPARIIVDGRGAEEPILDNDTPRNRLANRRVEIKLYVPPR